jgi:hypothetical protein
MLIGGVMGQPMAGIAASNEVDKSIAYRAEQERLAAAQNPMLRFMAERQGNLQSNLARLETDKLTNQARLQRDSIRQDQSTQNMFAREALQREGQAIQNTAIQNRSKALVDYRIGKEGEKEKEVKKTAGQLARDDERDQLMATWNNYPGVKVASPELLTGSYTTRPKDYQNITQSINQYNVIQDQADRYIDLVTNPQRYGIKDTATYNKKVEEYRAELVDQYREMKKYGANFSDVEQALVNVRVPLPLDTSGSGFVGNINRVIGRNTPLDVKEWNIDATIEGTRQAINNLKRQTSIGMRSLGLDFADSATSPLASGQEIIASGGFTR